MAAGERPHRHTKDPSGAGPLRQVSGLLRRVLERPLRLRRTPRLDTVRRSWLAAHRQARVSVRAGVPLDDFLRSRLARYLAALPVPPARLPLAVAIDDGQLATLPQETAPAAAPPDEAQGWLAALVAAEGPEVRQEAAELQIRLSVLEGRIEAARQRREELGQRFAADVAAGKVPAPPAIEATAEQMGRPPTRSSSPYRALVAFIGGTLLAAAWQVALPLLRAAGLDPSALRFSFEQRPTEVVFVVVFALGLAAGLFALADAALTAGERLFHGEPDPRRRRYLAAGAASATLLSVLVGAALAALHSDPGGSPGWTYVLLLLALPVGSALLVRFARADVLARAAEAPAALAWDRERARALVERGRRLVELEWADGEEQELERQRETARRRLREIEARAAEAARLETEAAERERAELSRLAQSLVAALDLDRYAFIREAAERGAAELISQRRRKPQGEARPVLEPAAAVETGRLAS